MTHKKKLIEVALPLNAINKAGTREKSILHGHPSICAENADHPWAKELFDRYKLPAPDNVVRIVTENSRTLKFTSQGFERE